MDRVDYGEEITRKPTVTEVEVAKRKGSAHVIASHLHVSFIESGLIAKIPLHFQCRYLNSFLI